MSRHMQVRGNIEAIKKEVAGCLEDVERARGDLRTKYDDLKRVKEASGMLVEEKDLEDFRVNVHRLLATLVHLMDTCIARRFNVGRTENTTPIFSQISDERDNLFECYHNILYNIDVLAKDPRAYHTLSEHHDARGTTRKVYSLHWYVSEQQLFHIHHTTQEISANSQTDAMVEISDDITGLCGQWQSSF
jgi:hypothetical protein